MHTSPWQHSLAKTVQREPFLYMVLAHWCCVMLTCEWWICHLQVNLVWHLSIRAGVCWPHTLHPHASRHSVRLTCKRQICCLQVSLTWWPPMHLLQSVVIPLRPSVGFKWLSRWALGHMLPQISWRTHEIAEERRENCGHWLSLLDVGASLASQLASMGWKIWGYPDPTWGLLSRIKNFT